MGSPSLQADFYQLSSQGSPLVKMMNQISSFLQPLKEGKESGCHGAFPGGSDSKESACNAGNLGLIPG